MKFLTLFLAALVLFATPMFAQSGVFAPYIDAGIGASSTLTGTSSLTARNPNYILGAGIESSTKHLLLDVNAQFNSQDYRTFGLANGDSYAVTATATGFLKFGRLLVGGGTFYKNQVVDGNIRAALFDGFSGNTFVPLVGGGFQFSRDRITALYELPGRSADNQRTVDFHNEVFLTKSAHLRLTQDVSLSTSVGSAFGITQRISGGSAAAGLKLVF